jgi:hypothetical protein
MRRTGFAVLWLLLALATLVLLVTHGDAYTVSAVFLAWVGGLVTHRLVTTERAALGRHR